MIFDTFDNPRPIIRNYRRILVYMTLFLLTFLGTVESCTRDKEPIEPEKIPPYSVDDWENGGIIPGSTDEGHPMTHEDSVRFGFI